MRPRVFRPGGAVARSLVLFGGIIASCMALRALSQDRADVFAWVRKFGGQYQHEDNDPNKPIVVLRLDRTREIDPGMVPEPLNAADLSQLVQFPHIREITLEERRIGNDALPHLARLVELQSLNLRETDVTGTGLAALAGLPKLESLDVSFCRIADDDAQSIVLLPQLKKLLLDGNSSAGMSEDGWRGAIASRVLHKMTVTDLTEYRGGLSDDGLRHVVQVTGLRELSLRRTRITDAGAKLLLQLRNLERLDLSKTAITDEALASIGQLKGLKSLSLSFVEISDRGLAHLSGLTDLEELHLRGAPISHEGLAHLHALTKLRSLDLSLTQVKEPVLDTLNEFTQLREIHLRQARISLAGLIKLADHHEHLDLRSVLINSGLIEKHGPVKASLDLSNQLVTNDDLAVLNQRHVLESMNRIDLRSTQITDEGLEHLKRLKGLEQLSLQNTPVTDAGLVHLRSLTRLKQLPIRDTHITLAGIIKLVHHEQKRSLTQALLVAGLIVRPADRQEPSAALFLDLHREAVTDDDLEEIVSGLADSVGNVDSLFLHDNLITDKGLAHLLPMGQLRVLSLNGKQITGVGLASIRRLPLLEMLWLTDTSISSEDLGLLARYPRLKALNLCGTAISETGVTHLCGLPVLQTLIVDSLALSPAAVAKLQLAHPGLTIVHSQKDALAAVRGRERRLHRLHNGGSMTDEMGQVITQLLEDPLITIFGDTYFEQARCLKAESDRPRAVERWQELTTLRELSFYNAPIRDEDLAAWPPMAEVTNLDLRETLVTHEGLVHLEKFPNLQLLCLGSYRASITDAALEHVGKLANLVDLKLNHTDITDRGLAHLDQLKELKWLELRGVRIAAGLQHLRALQQLEHLDLVGSNVTDESIGHLASLSNLQNLHLSQTMVSAAGIDMLRLQLPDTKIDSDKINELARALARPLAELDIPMYRDSNDAIFMLDLRDRDDVQTLMPRVLKLAELRELRLGSVATDDLLSRVAQLTTLKHLDISDSAVTEKGLRELAKLKRLEVLLMPRCRLSVESLKALTELPSLKALELKGVLLPPGASEQLAELKGLVGLGLASTDISDSELEPLVRLSELDNLILDNTPVTGAGLKHLQRHSKLRKLYLQNTAVDEASAEAFRKARPECAIVVSN